MNKEHNRILKKLEKEVKFLELNKLASGIATQSLSNQIYDFLRNRFKKGQIGL